MREFYPNGVVRYQTQYVEGRREGLERYFREDASLSRLAYVDAQGASWPAWRCWPMAG